MIDAVIRSTVMKETPGIIDVHTHIFNEETYLSYMAKAKGRVEKIITIQYWAAKAPPQYSLETLLDFAVNKEIFVMAAVNIHFDIPEQLRILERLAWCIIGIKMYPGYQYFYPSDELVYPVAEFCERYNKPLMFHSGGTSARGVPLLKYALPIHVDELATRYPKCEIVIAHFGFPYFLETALVVSKNENVYTDISGTIDKPPSTDALDRLVRQYKNDLNRVVEYFPDIKTKILFGTDYSGQHSHLNQFDPYIELVESVFTEEEQLKVFFQTANGLFFKG